MALLFQTEVGSALDYTDLKEGVFCHDCLHIQRVAISHFSKFHIQHPSENISNFRNDTSSPLSSSPKCCFHLCLYLFYFYSPHKTIFLIPCCFSVARSTEKNVPFNIIWCVHLLRNCEPIKEFSVQ